MAIRGPVELVQASFNYYTKHWKLFGGIAAIPLLTVALIQFLGMNAAMGGPGGYGMYMAGPSPFSGYMLLAIAVSFIANSLAVLGITLAVVEPMGKDPVGMLKKAWSLFVPFIVPSIFTAIIVTVGMIALIIPGVIAAVLLSFMPFMFVHEHKRGVDALKASYELAKSHFLDIFVRYLVAFVIAIIVSIISGIVFGLFGSLGVILGSFAASVFVVPFWIIFVYFLLSDIKNQTQTANVPATTPVVQPTAQNTENQNM